MVWTKTAVGHTCARIPIYCYSSWMLNDDTISDGKHASILCSHALGGLYMQIMGKHFIFVMSRRPWFRHDSLAASYQKSKCKSFCLPQFCNSFHC
jgi:hypothetical protein